MTVPTTRNASRLDRDHGQAGTRSSSDLAAEDTAIGRQTFVQVVNAALEAACEEHELRFDACNLFARLVLLADWRTAEVGGTLRALAQHLNIGHDRLRKLLTELVDADLIATEFRRGHDGKVTVLAYPDVVRLSAGKAETLRASLVAELEERPGQTSSLVGNHDEPAAETWLVGKVDERSSEISTRSSHNSTSDQGLLSAVREESVVTSVKSENSRDGAGVDDTETGDVRRPRCLCGKPLPRPSKCECCPATRVRQWHDPWRGNRHVSYCALCEPFDKPGTVRHGVTIGPLTNWHEVAA